MICHRCDQPINPQEQGGYVEQVALGHVRTPYHRRCWDENEHALWPVELLEGVGREAAKYYRGGK